MPTGVYKRKLFTKQHRVNIASAARKHQEDDYYIDGNGCWIWDHSLDTDGYGRYGKIRMFKHMYKKYVGAIPEGLVLDHLCHNRKCIYPGHLEPATLAENIRRQKNVKLNWNKVNEIKKLNKEGLKQQQIANRFDIHQCHVSRVLAELRWNQA